MPEPFGVATTIVGLGLAAMALANPQAVFRHPIWNWAVFGGGLALVVFGISWPLIKDDLSTIGIVGSMTWPSLGAVLVFAAFFFLAQRASAAQFEAVKMVRNNDQFSFWLPIKKRFRKAPARVVMELHSFASGRVNMDFVLTTEARISRGDTSIGLINIDKKGKRFLLFTYDPEAKLFLLTTEGNKDYQLPADDYRISINVVGDEISGARDFSFVRHGSTAHFSGDTQEGSFDVP